MKQNARISELENFIYIKQKTKEMSKKHVKCSSNILNVTICKESGHAQHDFESLEEGHWIFSSYKVNVMFILSESCSPGLYM